MTREQEDAKIREAGYRYSSLTGNWTVNGTYWYTRCEVLARIATEER